MTFLFRAIPLVAILALVGALVRAPDAGAQAGLARRAVFANAAADGFPTNLPPPDPSYCSPSAPGSTPPNSVIGTLTIAGQPAPAGTVVQIVFGEKLGPADATLQAGGYRVDYAAGPSGCANEVGTLVGIRVDGRTFMSAVKVGDETANPFLRFDVAAP